jgi:MoCo/4Fe-4S cofactor protein with predicted Tat translocation signal
MKDNKKTYWKGIEQLSNDPEYIKRAHSEFPEYLPINSNKENGGEGASRRDFLKMMGFGIAAASLAACEAPVKKAIPYLNKPVEIDPGIPNYYASTYVNGGDVCSIVVKTREGRPIKLAGNDLSRVFEGGMHPQVEASVLSLYDKERLTGPYINGSKGEWEALDKEVMSKLSSIGNAGGQIRIVSNTVASPTTQKTINTFATRYPTTQHVVYDPKSVYGIRKANAASFGQAVVPSYDFSKAKVIVSFGADFLGTWISPIEFTKQYSKTRKLGGDKKTMSRHYQFESNLSLTGSNADYRATIKPSQEGLLLGALYKLLGGQVSTTNIEASETLKKAAKELLAARGSSLVVSGSNDPDVQMLVNAINSRLGNYGTTIDLSTPIYMRQGDDEAMAQFVDDLKGGKISAVIFFNANPVYDHPRGQEIADALQKVQLTITTNDRMNETSSLVQYVAPDHHYLESWNDAEPKRGYLSLGQPAITPIFNTRQAPSSLLTWADNAETDYYTYLKNNWRESYYTNSSYDYETFWTKSLYDGVLQPETASEAVAVTFAGDVDSAAQRINRKYKADSNEIELVLYEKIALGTGSQANNPWLQELPDAVTKATWDNYLTMSKKMARELGVEPVEGKVGLVNLTVNGITVKLPALVQPGQADGTIGLALGYGRTKAGRVANGVGVDAFPFVRFLDGTYQYDVVSAVSVEKADGKYVIAQTQTQQTVMGRENVIQESILSAYVKDPKAGKHQALIATSEGFKEPESVSLWKGHKYPNHHWGMVIDLNSCTGCSTCIVACNAENNVPVVGKDEIANSRDMHWLRIDRYYSSDAAPDDLKALEIAAENPEVTFQPMLCQQCNNAPCETVCPVLATTHSTEGLNQMTYNRCIGTRYCANNCPYKVRRFNWFKYHDNKQFPENTSMNNDLGKMVLNPDVTVRARGVMEKCTFCVQRIQAGKLEAKREGRRPVDGDINTACANACPADAIVFGDMNDSNSRISKIMEREEQERAYAVLEYVGTRPNVFYLRKIRNKDEEAAADVASTI